MAWECPNCTAQNQGGIICEQCGFVRKIAIRLTSATGKTFETGINFKVDRRIYKDIESDYQYLSNTPGSYQFMVLRNEESPFGWVIQTSPSSDLNTLVNDGVCQVGQIYSLNPGDVIKIGSRRNEGVTAAPLVVSFEGE